MEIRPDYYDDFKCIAGECKHNCCIGWEIDIDDVTLKKYKKISGSLGEKLQKNISPLPTAHFVLGKSERCPFLNQDNLCELIICGGEDMLCDICKEHPRFYNDTFGITEKGIGISCEAAAKIILSKQSKFCLISDGELPNNDFFAKRSEIFNILQERTKPLTERISNLLKWANISSPIGKINWIAVYKGLERLDLAWDERLDRLTFISENIPNNLETAYEQLICYFIYRHLSGALNDFLFYERIRFAVLSCFFIASLNRKNTMEELLNIARMYSCEIEYSDENIQILLEKLEELNM